MDGVYQISTTEISVEVLKILGQQALQEVFAGTQVLGLLNICGEGCSMTIAEFDLIRPHLELFPHHFVEFLLYSKSRKMTPDIESLMVEFVQRLLKFHPHSGETHHCNKLLMLLNHCSSDVHQKIK